MGEVKEKISRISERAYTCVSISKKAMFNITVAWNLSEVHIFEFRVRCFSKLSTWFVITNMMSQVSYNSIETLKFDFKFKSKCDKIPVTILIILRMINRAKWVKIEIGCFYEYFSCIFTGSRQSMKELTEEISGIDSWRRYHRGFNASMGTISIVMSRFCRDMWLYRR